MLRTRRDLLGNLGVMMSAIAASQVFGERGALDLSRPLATDVPAGTKVAAATVARVERLRDGAVPIVLRDADGATFEVEVLRHDPGAPGVARAGTLAVYVNNGGGGSTPTNEAHGLAAMALARVIAAREAAGAVVPALVSMRERGPRVA